MAEGVITAFVQGTLSGFAVGIKQPARPTAYAQREDKELGFAKAFQQVGGVWA